MKEKHLKSWLKLTYAGNINCVEPAYGSSIGMPDVEVSVHGTIIPIELKIGMIGKRGGISLDIRPSQRRYHILAAEKNQKTAIMFAVGNMNCFDVYLFHGKYVENDKWKNQWWKRLAGEQNYLVPFDREKIDSALANLGSDKS